MLRVTYEVAFSKEKATPDYLQKAARKIAVGQTLGTEKITDPALIEAYLGQVISVDSTINPIDSTETLARITIDYPDRTVISDFGALLCISFGKISMAGKIRVVDYAFSPELIARYQGPRYGLEGIRERVGVKTGPLLMSIFKPCLGVPAEKLGDLFYQQAVGGMNLVKDDEILSDLTFEDARRRLTACLKAGEKAKAETGRQTLYAVNLNGPAETLLARAKTLVADGAQCLLFNYLCYGFPLLNALRSDPAVTVPIMAHPALAGALSGSETHGFAPHVLFGQLPRLAGADLVLYPSPFGSVSLTKEKALAIHHALIDPHPELNRVMSVPSAGITTAMVPELLSTFGSNFIINAGTGVHDHPEGSLAGAKAFYEALHLNLARA